MVRIHLPIQELQEARVGSLAQKDLLEKEMATQSSILARIIPWTEEPGSLHCPWSKKSDITEHACALCPAYLASLRKLSDMFHKITLLVVGECGF